MANIEPAEQHIALGRSQAAAGIALLQWSRTVTWNPVNRRFHSNPQEEFESIGSPLGHRQVHPEYGRVLCWLALGVGAEYLAKGACLVQGCLTPSMHDVLRAPVDAAELETWILDATQYGPRQNPPSHLTERRQSLGTLGRLPLERLPVSPTDTKILMSAYRLLATYRNREAHLYAKEARAANHYTVGLVFVPAFNLLVDLTETPLH